MANFESDEDKKNIPGFVYLQDDGRDLKFGITRNLERRQKDYITENPRLRLHESFIAESFYHAEQIESELINATVRYRTHGNEWCARCEEVFAIWDTAVRKHATLTYTQWLSKRTEDDLNWGLSVVAADLSDKIPEGSRQGHVYDSCPDFFICRESFFDGSLRAAREILFSHVRTRLEENDWVYTRWEETDPDLTVVSSAYLRSLSEHYQIIDGRVITAGVLGFFLGVIACILLFLLPEVLA